MTLDQINEFISELRQVGKPDEAEMERIHFLLIRGADLEVVRELYVRRTLLITHWSHLIKDFSGLGG